MMGSYQYVKTSRQNLKDRIVYVMGDSCSICGYQRSKRALELHHIDPTKKDFTIGTNTNQSWIKVRNEIEKCVLVCANCHREIHDELIKSPSQPSFNSDRANEIDLQLKDIKERKLSYCKNCGKLVSRGNDQCSECYYIAKRLVDRPDRNTLKELIRTTPFTKIAKSYGLSDNAIRKWCKKENLPTKKTEINLYSDEEWILV